MDTTIKEGTNTVLTIGMIGVGQMGTPMAKNLLKARYGVAVYDINAKQMDLLVQAGAKKARNPKDLAAQSDVVITVLTWPKVVEEVLLGRDGVLEGLKNGAIVIECSSIDHETSIRIAQKIEAGGGKFVEAALMGRPFEIESKKLLFLTAGKKETVEECEAVFAAMGRKALYTGDFGAAKLVKIANAMFNAAETTVIYEVLAWCLSNHVSQESFLELLKERVPSRVDPINRILSGELDRQPSWTAKDVYHGLKLAEEKEIPMPVLSTLNATINMAKSQNPEGFSFSGMMWKFYERTLKNR
jgi:2-hydroxy-3-oxopropionate reductase